MPHALLSVSEFIDLFLQEKLPVIDTRSESEFSHASLPGSCNIPILNDAHRKEVGTVYKQKGKEEAVLKGFELAGPHFHEMIRQASKIAPAKKVLVYCWRGGMRSNILSWILELSGFQVYLLKGGYKAYRNWTLRQFEEKRNVLVLGGATGSGKTEKLMLLAAQGEQVIDLEGLANHKGSAFGALGKGAQPFNEMFENRLALEWYQTNPAKYIWLENESRSIGSCMLPASIYELIRNSELIEIEVGTPDRKQRIAKDYGCFPVKDLSEITLKISKRLGPQHAKEAISLLQSGDFDGWLEIVLSYYDKLYNYGNTLRDQTKIHPVDLTEKNDQETVSILIKAANKIMKPVNSN